MLSVVKCLMKTDRKAGDQKGQWYENTYESRGAGGCGGGAFGDDGVQEENGAWGEVGGGTGYGGPGGH